MFRGKNMSNCETNYQDSTITERPLINVEESVMGENNNVEERGLCLLVCKNLVRLGYFLVSYDINFN